MQRVQVKTLISSLLISLPPLASMDKRLFISLAFHSPFAFHHFLSPISLASHHFLFQSPFGINEQKYYSLSSC
jgi:hypothetical protein